MRLGWAKTKYSISYYIQKTVYENGKNKSVKVKSLGSEKYICQTYGVTDAKAWAKEQVRLMNEAEKSDYAKFQIDLDEAKDLDKDSRRKFNGGYLFLQNIYYELGLHKICRAISRKNTFEYDLNNILSRLVFTRILFPCSKKSSFEESKRFIEQPTFELHHVYRSLSVLAKESDYIQSVLFKNSSKIYERKTDVIYYDCTNYYFEIDQTEDDKQYGASKEHRPNPIIEMGLFMDMEGIPVAFGIYPGNDNEQNTLIPLEKKMMEQYNVTKFTVCTDAGLSSGTNRDFNSQGQRTFITVQSIKKLKSDLKKWALDSKGWMLPSESSDKTYDISQLNNEADKEKIFYKSCWIEQPTRVKQEDGTVKIVNLKQQFIVSYSIKYRDYLRKKRNDQVARAEDLIKKGASAVERKRTSDPKRFIKTEYETNEGEKAKVAVNSIDQNLIDKEEQYDGFYALCTNLETNPETIVMINDRRWEIEECFKIMKDDFEARPVFVQRKDRIIAHFITCFIALIVYRYLEKKLGNKYTTSKILYTLRDMDFTKYEGIGYLPSYDRTDITDDLHKAFGFCTSKEIISVARMRNICSNTKKVEV